MATRRAVWPLARTRPCGQDGTPCRHQAMTVGRRTEDGHLEEAARMALADELAYATATELASRMRRRELSPVEVVDACIERIQARNDSLNALVYLGLNRILLDGRPLGTAPTGWSSTEVTASFPSTNAYATLTVADRGRHHGSRDVLRTRRDRPGGRPASAELAVHHLEYDGGAGPDRRTGPHRRGSDGGVLLGRRDDPGGPAAQGPSLPGRRGVHGRELPAGLRGGAALEGATRRGPRSTSIPRPG